MNSAPAWVSYASTAIAFIALVVSLRTFNRAGPRVKVLAEPPRKWMRTDPELRIKVTAFNSGLAPVQIVSIRAHFAFFAITSITPTLDLKSNLIEGKDTPITLNNGHQETWEYDAMKALKQAFSKKSLTSHFLDHGIDINNATNANLVSLALRTALRSLFPAIRNGFIPGLYIVVDLGNGVQVRSRAMFRVGFQLLRLTLESLPERSEDT